MRRDYDFLFMCRGRIISELLRPARTQKWDKSDILMTSPGRRRSKLLLIGIHRDTVSSAMHEISSPTCDVPRIGLSKEFVWKHRWLPKAAAATSWLLFLTAFFWRKSELLILLFTAVALLCTYAWGYSDRAFRLFFSPALTHLKRKEYAAVWGCFEFSFSISASCSWFSLAI